MHLVLFVAFCGSFLVNATPPPKAPPPPLPAVGKAALTIGILPTKYLSIKDYKKCLLSSGATGTSTSLCMPDKKPTDCCDQSWKQLCALEGKEKLPPCGKSGPPPKYTEIKDYTKCVLDHPIGKGQKCLPSSKPATCCDDSWKRLTALTGVHKLYTCPVVRPAPPPVIPTNYHDIKNWQKCLENKKEGNKTTFVCLPTKKPNACIDYSWKKLCALSGNAKPKSCSSPPSPSPPPVRPQPKYLSVKDYKKCLSTCPNNGTSTNWCLPDKKPVECCEQSWKALHGFTGNDKVATCKKS